MEDFLNYIIWGNTVQSYLWFLGIILLAFIFKRIISKKLSNAFYDGFKKYFPEIEAIDSFFSLLIKPIEYLIVIIAVSIAVNVLEFPPAQEGKRSIDEILNLVVQFGIVLNITWIILRIIDFIAFVLTKKAEKTQSKADDQIIQFVKETLKIITYIFSLLFILGAVFNFNISTLIAGLGIGGLAVAFAAKDTIENLIASLIIFMDKPFIIGDYIKVGNIDGIVEKIGFRSTRIRTLEKSYLTLPNKTLVNEKLDNLTLRTSYRAKLHIRLTYETTTEQIKAIVKDIQQYIDEHPKLNKNGLVRFEDFGESSLDITILYFVDTKEYAQYLTVKEEINFKIIEIVKKNGSNFAFPTRTIQQYK